MFSSLQLKKLSLFISVFAFSAAGFSQPIMKRSSFAGTYTPISIASGATQSTATGDNSFQDFIPIGFPFNYLGSTYSTIGASTNGLVAFTGISASASNMDLYSFSAPHTVLAPWWDDLKVQSGTGSILYQLQGNPGTQTFTIQWTDVHSFNTGSTALLNFQVILYELNNKIEFRYDAAPSGIFNSNESASIGIKSAIGGNGEYIDAVTGSRFTGNGMLSASNMWPSHFFRFVPGTILPVSQGVFSVGITGDYYNLSEAVADINHRGVTGTGTIILSLIDSLYDETPLHGDNFFPILIGPIAGASITSSIHIEPFGSAAVIASPGATAGYCASQNSSTAIGISNEPVIGIVGADFTSLSTSIGNLVLASSTSNVDRGLLVINSSLTDGSRNCGFMNLTIALDRTNTNTIGIEQTSSAALSSYAGSNSWNVYQSIIISDAYSGIRLNGDIAFPDSSTTMTGNIVGGSTADDIGNGALPTFGIYATNQSNIAIIENLVRNISVNGNVSCTGIHLDPAMGISNVYGNKVRNIHNNSVTSTTNVIGISADVKTTGTHQLYIYNNFVSGIKSFYSGVGSAAIQVKGISIQGGGGGTSSSVIHVDFNNVHINNASLLNSSACFESGTTSGPVINTRNNIFVNSTASQTTPAAHFCIVTPTANAIGNAGSVSNHNDLFIPNPTRGFIGKGNASTYASLANWQAAMLSDAQSLSIDPLFASVTDMHVLSSGLNAAGMALPWVPMDIDNQVRGVTPDIGADEIFPPDASPVSLISPVAATCYTTAEPVVVRIVNAGNSLLDFTMDSVLVTVEITGAITQTLTVMLNDNSRNNGNPLPIGGYADVILGTINMTSTGSYIFNVYTTLPSDGNPSNDTLGPITINVSAPTVNISGNSNVCEGNATTLTANVSGGDGNFSYQWSSGLGSNSSVTFTPTQDNIVYVSVTDGCGYFANDSILIQLIPDPTAMFTYSVTNNTVTFTDNSQNTTGWSWDFGNSQSSSQQNPTHTYAVNGTYTVILTTTNGCGSDTASAVISIITTGIDPFDEEANEINVFPNPANEAFTIYFPGAETDLVVELVDVNGKLIQRKEIGNTVEGTSFFMDISAFESGIYFLHIYSARISKVQKVVIER